MNTTIDLIEKYGERYLICDGKHPLLSSETLWDEILLYNLSAPMFSAMLQHFQSITGKSLRANSQIMQLSGGQKTLLMFLLAYYSPASRILFVNLMDNLDSTNRIIVNYLIYQTKDKEIRLYEHSDSAL